MRNPPKLAPVPSTIQNPLTRKATLTGITYLKQGKYGSRYLGNKHYAVDINGNLLPAAELKKIIQKSKPPAPKRKAPVETGAGTKNFRIPEPLQISCNPGSLPNLADTPAPETSQMQRGYKIKKSLVRHRLLNYINSQNGKKQLFFFTVTFPMGTADDVAYKIFNIWLTSLRKYKMLKNYLWVAERQGEKSKINNTTIHFHIAVPHFMSVQKANAMMAGTLKTFAKRGEIPCSVYACRKYNGVDIAKHRNTKRVINFAIKKGGRALGNYLTKYVTKNDSTFTHLAWHNSRGFSSVFTGVTFNKDEFQKNCLWKHLDFSKKFENEWIVFFPWKFNPPPLLTTHIDQLNSFIQSQLN